MAQYEADEEGQLETLCTIHITSSQRDQIPVTIGERASKLIMIAFADLVEKGLIAIEVEHWEQGKKGA